MPLTLNKNVGIDLSHFITSIVVMPEEPSVNRSRDSYSVDGAAAQLAAIGNAKERPVSTGRSLAISLMLEGLLPAFA
jgi:hypothetical protein